MASSPDRTAIFSVIAGMALTIAPFAAVALDPQSPVLVSRTHLGAPAFGPCGNPHFAKGASRYLVFYCFGALTPDDDNDRPDTFFFDRRTGVLERVSLTSTEEEIRFESFDGFPSNNGRYVALESLGPLHPDATPNFPGFERRNTFLRDRMVGATEFISRNTAGVLAQREVGLEDALPERNEVLLQTASRLLSPNDPPGSNDTNLYIRNWTTGAIELISQTADGSLGDNSSVGARLTPNGRYVVFNSTSTNLPDAPPPLSGNNLYLRDRIAQTTQRLTFPWHGGEFSGSFHISGRAPLSSDGRYVIFASNHPEVLPIEDGIDLLWQQVYVLDRQSGLTERISVDANGHVSNGYNGSADISDNGRYLAFYSRSTNLPAGGPAIYVIDRQTDEWVNVTAPLGPQTGNVAPSLELARDGSAIAFSWRVSDPAQPDVFDRILVYVVDLGTNGPSSTPMPVPGLKHSWLLALCIAMLAAAFLLRLRARV